MESVLIESDRKQGKRCSMIQCGRRYWGSWEEEENCEMGEEVAEGDGGRDGL